MSEKQEQKLSLKGKRILVVDDIFDNRNLESLYLRREGAEVDTANNGAEAVEKAMVGNHDAIVMDLHMPILDGLQATAQLREQGYKKPIIAVTADCMKEMRLMAFENGCDDYLSKPLGSFKLIQALHRLFAIYFIPKFIKIN
jgi:CheY-like chemotaxis protein